MFRAVPVAEARLVPGKVTPRIQCRVFSICLVLAYRQGGSLRDSEIGWSERSPQRVNSLMRASHQRARDPRVRT